jgi:glycosyltransferase involved in cell wall biosynthesis
MKIIHIISSLGNGGAEKLTVELANEMAKEHDVTICSFRDIEDWMIFPKKLQNGAKLVTFRKRAGFDPLLYYKLIKFINKFKPDVINLHLGSSLTYLLPISNFFRKTSFYYTIHSNYDNHKKTFDLLYKLKKIHFRFICISESIYKEFESAYLKFNFHLIPNGIDKMKTTTNKEDSIKEIVSLMNDQQSKMLVAVGRISNSKNYHLLMDVMKNIIKDNVFLIVIGPNSTSENLIYESLIDEKPHNVYFFGLKENVADYLKSADAFIMSSLYEGMPITAIEAMSMGLPVICTPAGGLVDMIKPGINGFIADDFTEEALLEQVYNFLNADDETLAKIRENNIREFREKYSIERCASEYLRLYKQILNESAKERKCDGANKRSLN